MEYIYILFATEFDIDYKKELECKWGFERDFFFSWLIKCYSDIFVRVDFLIKKCDRGLRFLLIDGSGSEVF